MCVPVSVGLVVAAVDLVLTFVVAVAVGTRENISLKWSPKHRRLGAPFARAIYIRGIVVVAADSVAFSFQHRPDGIDCTYPLAAYLDHDSVHMDSLADYTPCDPLAIKGESVNSISSSERVEGTQRRHETDIRSIMSSSMMRHTNARIALIHLDATGD